LKLFVVYISLFSLLACQPTTKTNSNLLVKNDVAKRLDSARYFMQNVNAAYIIYIDSNNRVFEKHWGKSNNYGLVNDTTIFEGASLSKTVTAYLFWTLVKHNKLHLKPVNLPMCNGGTASISLKRLLRHSVRSSATCVNNYIIDSFRYSEDNYLLLQQYIEEVMGKNLNELARENVFKPLKMSNSSFVWNKDMTDYVDGYFQDQKVHRKMYQFKEPLANGSLYTCASDLIRFAKALRDSGLSNKFESEMINVHQYKKLHWGLGMGIDSSLNRDLLWQWGCNWSYNHILLYDVNKKDIVIGLTNSIIGAKRLRFTCNFLLNKELELFNYINWY